MTRNEFLAQRLAEQKKLLVEYEALWEKYNLLSHFDPDGFERMYYNRLAFTTEELMVRLELKMESKR